MDQRRTSAGELARGRKFERGWNSRTGNRRTGTTGPSLRLLSPKGAKAQGFRSLSRYTVRRFAGGNVRHTYSATTGRVARSERYRSGNGGLHRSLCGPPSDICGGCLYAPRARASRRHWFQGEVRRNPFAGGTGTARVNFLTCHQTDNIRFATSGGASTLCNEYGYETRARTNLQRDAWPFCAIGKTLLC